jgi:hypothetical protein
MKIRRDYAAICNWASKWRRFKAKGKITETPSLNRLKWNKMNFFREKKEND